MFRHWIWESMTALCAYCQLSEACCSSSHELNTCGGIRSLFISQGATHLSLCLPKSFLCNSPLRHDAYLHFRCLLSSTSTNRLSAAMHFSTNCFSAVDRCVFISESPFWMLPGKVLSACRRILSPKGQFPSAAGRWDKRISRRHEAVCTTSGPWLEGKAPSQQWGISVCRLTSEYLYLQWYSQLALQLNMLCSTECFLLDGVSRNWNPSFLYYFLECLWKRKALILFYLSGWRVATFRSTSSASNDERFSNQTLPFCSGWRPTCSVSCWRATKRHFRLVTAGPTK